jgi:hypothetical protein
MFFVFTHPFNGGELTTVNIFPQIKIRSRDLIDLSRVKRLKKDLRMLRSKILSYTPSDYNSHKLNRLRFRIFKFSRKEGCNEFFIIDWNRKYVCLNSSILNRRYYSALLHLLHGIAHSFCHLKDEIAEEAFCEYVSYSILKEFLKHKGKRFRRKIFREIMKKSPKNYNKYYRAARKLEKKKKGTMLRMNIQAKNRKISKKEQKKLFYKLTRLTQFEDDDSSYIPELELGFKKI